MNKIYKTASSCFATLGILCITSGVMMPNLIKFEKNSVGKLEVNQKQVSVVKSNEIKLKDINIEVGSVLSTDIKNYLANPNDVDNIILKILKLDISNVNVNNVGNYTYTITYDKKIYNGTVNVIQKTLPNVDNITLKNLSYEVNTQLPKDINSYIKESLPPEVISAIRLDTSNVNISTPGNYLYSISYNGKLYTNTITIYEPQIIVEETETKSN